MRNHINVLTMRLASDLVMQGMSTLLDASSSRHSRSDDFDTIGGHGFFDASPVVHAWEPFASQTELVKAEKTMCEDDRMFGNGVMVAEVGEVGFDGLA